MCQGGSGRSHRMFKNQTLLFGGVNLLEREAHTVHGICSGVVAYDAGAGFQISPI